MNRRRFLKNCALSIGTFSLAGCASGMLDRTTSKKPVNVLFIAADDLNIDIGCYGNQQVKTPNLDRLAAMGVRFDRAYCQYPLCGPSRASIMSGLRPDTTGFLNNKDDLRKLKPDTITMGQFFQQKGYYVGRVGKIFHYGNPGQIGTNGHDDPLSWQERFNPAGIDKLQEEKIIRYPEGKGGYKDKLGTSMSWWDPESKDIEHTDGMVAARAVEMIDRNKNKPFFVAAGFFNPHCPYVAPKKYFDMYPLDQITMQDLEEAKKDLEDVPAMAVQWDMRNWPYFFKDITYDQARKCKQAYYACISFIDAQVGLLLDAIEQRNLLDNTLVVFWSDHGYFLGGKGLWVKRKNFERAVRAPLLIAGPGINSAGEACAQPVELLDLYPTIADYTGFDVPDKLEGQSLRPLLSNPNSTWDKPAISQVQYGSDAKGYSIRTMRWRYTEWNGGNAGRELYDHANDPDEVHNLAGLDKYADTVKRLSWQLQPFARKDY